MNNLKEAMKRGYLKTGATVGVAAGAVTAALPAQAGDLLDAVKPSLDAVKQDGVVIAGLVIACIIVACGIALVTTMIRKV